MSVLSRPLTLRRTPVVPAPRPAAHDGGIPSTDRRPSPPEDRTSRRRRAALLLVALVAAIAAGITTAVVQLTGDDTAQLAPTSRLSGVTELNTISEEKLLRQQLNSDASRASTAARDAAQVAR